MLFRSTSPVTVKNSQGQQVQADLWIVVNNSGGVSTLPKTSLPDSTGSVSLTFTSQTQGTFSSSLTVNSQVYLVTPNSNNPANTSTYVTTPFTAPQINLSSANSTFQTTAPANDQHNSTYTANGFYPTQVKHTGPHPVIPPVPCTSCCYLCCNSTVVSQTTKPGTVQREAALRYCNANPTQPISTVN